MVASMIENAGRGEIVSYDVATVLATLGRKDEAIRWLERAINQREPAVVSLQQDPFLQTLHTDPRFPALVRRVGLPFRPPRAIASDPRSVDRQKP